MEGRAGPYRFFHSVEVRFRDLDPFGHVNNAVYLTYLESARIAYWLHVGGGRDLRTLGMILARVELDYRSPLVYGETAEIGVRCLSMKRSSFVLDFEAKEGRDKRIVAQSRNVLVHYDYAAGRSVPLPDDLRARILAQDPEAEQL